MEVHKLKFFDDNVATVEFWDGHSFKPTNVKKHPWTIVLHESTGYYMKYIEETFFPSKDDPLNIVWIKQNINGVPYFNFLDEDQQKIYEEAISEAEKIFKTKVYLNMSDYEKWGDFIFNPVTWTETNLAYTFGYSLLRGDKYIDPDDKIELEKARKEISEFKPIPMTIDQTPNEIPYFVMKPNNPNGGTIVWVCGGPMCHIDMRTLPEKIMLMRLLEAGYTIILPQEYLRDGYGFNHFRKGAGEAGRGNCLQILDIVNDAINKRFVPNDKSIHLAGASYGGYQALAHAVGLRTFINPYKFQFQSCMAIAASVGSNQSQYPYYLPDMNEDRWLEKISLSSYTRNLIPLYIVHDIADAVCPYNPILKFFNSLSDSGGKVELFFTEGVGHNIGIGYDNLLIRWINRIQASLH